MKQLTPFFKFFLLFVLVGSASILFAQQDRTVRMEGERMRTALDVPEGATTIHLCSLQPGNTYQVIALGAADGQRTTFMLRPSGNLARSASDLQMLPNRNNALRFTAPAECVDVVVTAQALQELTTIPMYLSVSCETCPNSNAWQKKFADQVESANLAVISGISAQSLVTNTLVGGDCFEVQNVTSMGNGLSRGVFTNGSGNIGIERGVVLSTGNVNTLPGPNTFGGTSTGFNFNSFNDPDLTTLAQGNQYDLSKIEFDFTPTASMVQFDFIFGSEEYCEYVNTEFNDVFGFFISGPGITGTENIALIPGTSTPVTVNNVNYQTNSQYYVNNNNFFLPSPACFFLPTAALDECELDGWTTQFTAVANVIPCSTYHIKLAIADVGDSQWNSAVFLRANSFEAGGTANAEAVYPNGLPNAFEGCTDGYIRFFRDSSGINDTLQVNFTVGGNATPGVDYAPLSGPIVFPPGITDVILPVEAFLDNDPEGQDTIVLMLDNACSCDQLELQYLINDAPPPLQLSLSDQNGCFGGTVTLTPEVTDGLPPYQYTWSTGDTTATLTVGVAGAYIVTASDLCGTSITDSALVMLGPPVELSENVSFCAGDSVVVAGMVFTGSGTIIDTLPGMGGACDTVITYTVEELPVPMLSDTILFCPGDSVTLAGNTYYGPAVVTDTLPGLGGGCDTLITYTLQLRTQVILSDTIIFCEGDSIIIGGVAYTGSGVVMDTLPGQDGACDTLVTYTLEVLPKPERAETLALCPRETVIIEGVTYTAPATVAAIAPGQNGACDTLVTYVLELRPQPTRAETITFCPGETVTIGGVPYTSSATVVDTIPGQNGACDTIVTYTLERLPQPTRAETIAFCPGETITIGNQAYNQPGIVNDTIPAATGCDTIVTYTLKYLTPAPSTVSISCPNNIALSPAAPTTVKYDNPVADSDCPCPGLAVELTSGLPSGSVFPFGANTVCYTATDSCGNTASCCFTVTLTETTACDIKEIGCIKFELLSVTRDAMANTTFRIRVTNNCPNELIYTAFQLPKGVVANSPVDNSVYTAPSGREYDVRNPNFSPIYSIRFSSAGAGIANGASDIFEYTLPPRRYPQYINAIAKVATQTYYEAHLNTFYCPIGVTPPGARQEQVLQAESTGLQVFPNPTTGVLYADLSAWQGQAVTLRVFDGRGLQVLSQRVSAESGAQDIRLPDNLATGLYILEAVPTNGEKQVVRFVVQR